MIEKAADVAGGYVEKKEDVVNMLKQQEGVASNQVMLRVRFAEVSRSAMQELGVSFFANGSGTSDQWYRPLGTLRRVRRPTSRTASSCSATS